MHKERLIAIDTIILFSESTLNHSKLAQHSLGKKLIPFWHVMDYDKHFTYKQLPLLISIRGFGRALLKFVMMQKADLSSSRFLAGRCTEEDASKGGQKLVRY